MADSVRSRLRQTTHTTRGAVLTGARWLGHQEASVLVAALGILLALFGFIKISEELGEGELAHLDEWVLHLLRVPGDPHTSIGPSWLLEAAQDITSLGRRTMLVAVTLFTIGYLLSSERTWRPRTKTPVLVRTSCRSSTTRRQTRSRGFPVRPRVTARMPVLE